MKKIIILLFILLFSCHSTKYINIINLYEIKGLHFFDVKINGKKAKILVDTGASKSLLDINKAKEYNFECILVSKDKYFGLGGQGDLYIIYNYEVEPFHITFLGTDLSTVSGYFDGKIPIVGILGMDFLEYYEAKIDIKKNKIYLNQSDTIELQIINK